MTRKELKLGENGEIDLESISLGDILIGQKGDKHLVTERKGTFVDTVTHFEGYVLRLFHTYKGGKLKTIGPEFIPEKRPDYEVWKRKLTEEGIW